MNADWNHLEDRIPQILQLGFAEPALPALKAYLQLLWRSNEELNLISRKMTIADLIDNHVIDSLLPLKHFPVSAINVADFGSGGGLPAVIYALHFPQLKFHLFEKSNLKQIFLKSCIALAPNIEVHADIPKDLKSIDLVTARGFKPVDVILQMSESYFRAGGKYFLLKGRREKIDEELGLALKRYKTVNSEVIALRSPVLDVERHVVKINC